MINITYTNGDDYFNVNGKNYARVFQAVALGATGIGIFNVNDLRQTIIPTTSFDEIRVNGVNFNNREELIINLIPILYQQTTIIDNTTIGSDRITASTQPPSGIPQNGEEWVIYKTED